MTRPNLHPARASRAWIFAALLMSVLPIQALATDTYDFDPAHSSPGFAVKHIFTMVHGRFKEFSGVLQYDPAKPEAATVEITIQTASITTENDRRDNHLRSADFFDATNFPTITFKSTKIEPGATKDHFNVTGDLTMRGVTKPVVVDVQLLGFGDTGMGVRGGLSASATINRQDFGVKWNKALETGGMLLGDEVTIDFPVEVVKRAS